MDDVGNMQAKGEEKAKMIMKEKRIKNANEKARVMVKDQADEGMKHEASAR